MAHNGSLGGTRTKTLVAMLMMLSLLVLDIGECGRGGEGRRGKGGGRRTKRGNLQCSKTSMAEYRLTFYGAWSRNKFPRMYPRYRPIAQWSKLVGRSHNADYQMWRKGQMADPSLERFAEDGDSLMYDMQPQGYHGIMDIFSAVPITGGEGKTSTFIMADGLHSKISFVVKMVPSPDWFVGVDSLDLCRRGRWRARAHANLRPMDAGTDRGYTFSSPNWPLHPHEPIYQITSSQPDHPASAFLYPEYKRLPRIAYVRLERVAQYVRKGGVSPIKTDRGTNLVVVGAHTSEGTTATADLNIRTHSVHNDSATLKNLTKTTETLLTTVSMTQAKDAENNLVAEAGMDRDLNHEQNDDYAADGVSPYTHHPHPLNPINKTTTPTTTTVSRITAGPQGSPSPSAAADNDDMRPVGLKNELNIHQQNSSHINQLGSVEQTTKLETSAVENLNEMSRESDMAHKESPDGVSKENEQVMISSVRPPAEGYITSTTAVNTVTVSSTSNVTFPAESSPGQEGNHGESAATTVPKDSLPLHDNSIVTVIPALPEIVRTNFPTSDDSESPEVLSATSSPLMSSSLTSVKAVVTTKAAPPLSSPDNHAQKVSRTGGRPRMRSGNYGKYRRTNQHHRPEPTEPAGSQSRRTFDDPQFAEVSVDEYEDPVDCRVAEWSEWSPCSKTCGFGVRTRSREVIDHSRNGGFGCPVLAQETLCGGMGTCNWKHFGFLNRRRRMRKPRDHD